MNNVFALAALLSACLSSASESGRTACPRGATTVQRASYRPESNGCSKPAFFKVEGEEDFTYCCDRHGKLAGLDVEIEHSKGRLCSVADVCYQTCGIDKSTCESQFQRCLSSMCTRNFKRNAKCLDATKAYVLGVQMFGQSSFESSQESACECVPKDSIRSHYETLLNEFYKRHAPSRRAEAMSSARVVAALVSVAFLRLWL